MAKLNTEHFLLCINTLEASLRHLNTAQSNSIDYAVFRCVTIKGFELVLELPRKLLRKALKTSTGNPQAIDELAFKDVFRHAAKHETTIKLFPQFIADAKDLQKKLSQKIEGENA